MLLQVVSFEVWQTLLNFPPSKRRAKLGVHGQLTHHLQHAYTVVGPKY